MIDLNAESFTYCDITLDTHDVFYVGKGTWERVLFLPRLYNKNHGRVVAKHGMYRVVVFSSDDEAETLAKEIELIKEYHTFKRDKLRDEDLASNGTRGGEGISGHVHSEETKAKIIAARTGYVHSDESRAKMKDAHTGLKHSDETRAKMKDNIKASQTLAARKQKSESQIKRCARERELRAADPEHDKQEHDKLSAAAKAARARERAAREADPALMAAYKLERAETGRKISETKRLKRLNKL